MEKRVTTNMEKPKKYNPQNTSKTVLIDTFVIRLKEFQRIWEAIASSKMEVPEQSYIIQGVRGAGKTTLLSRLAFAVEDHEELSKWLIPVQFKEEEYGVSTLFNLWLKIAEVLAEQFEEGSTENIAFDTLVEEIEAIDPDDEKDYEIAYKLLDKSLHHRGKKILLLIDNIADLFDTFTKTDRAFLREVLSQNAKIRIVGGSAIALESFYDHSEPLYQFFSVITLERLSREETEKFLLSLGKISGPESLKNIRKVLKEEPQKIESIRRLTGGVPRTIYLLFEILAEGAGGTTFQYLDETLDMVSGIYKHRMDDLSAQQKPIVHAIAQNWDAMSAKEIAQKTRISSKNVSAQLTQLQKQWIIEKISTDTKNHLYRVQERFFNIWYLTRYGIRKDKAKVRWLTRFLETWCTPEELMNRVAKFPNELKGSVYLQGMLAYTSAMMGLECLPIEHKELLRKTAKETLSAHKNNELINELPAVSGSEYLKSARECIENEEFDRAESFLKTAIEKGELKSNLLLGNLYADQMHEYSKAEQAYQQAIENGDTGAYLNLGILYADQMQEYSKAEQAFQQAIENGDTGGYLNLGILYADQMHEYSKAEQAYQQAIENGDTGAYLNLGILYADQMNEYSKAEQAYQQAIENGDTGAYLNLGILYADQMNEYSKAEQAYQQAIENGDTGAYLNLGILYSVHMQEYSKAEQAYQQAIESGDTRAYLILGILYSDQMQEYSKAEQAYQQAIENGDTQAYLILGNLYSDQMHEYSKAEQAYQQAIENGDTRAYLILGNLYIFHMHEYSKAEQAYQQAIENGDTLGYLNLGNLYRDQMHEYSKAEQAFQQAIENGDTGGYINLGNLYRNQMHEYSKAEQAFQQAIENGDTRAYLILGILYSDQMQEYSKAEQAYQQAIENGDTRAYLILGILYSVHMQEYSKAEQAYQQAIENGDTQAYLILGNFYKNQMQEYSKAEQAYQQAIENGDEEGINTLSWIYFEKADFESKRAALKLLSKLKGCKQVVTNRHTSISIDLWNEDIESAKGSAEELFKMDDWLTDSTQADMIDLFLLFLAKGQFNLVDKWLTEFTLKDRLKPLYYTLMYFMQDKYPREYLRMGSELQETVDEMLARVEELKEKYA